MQDLSFFENKRVLVTGHTGFKGSWLSHILVSANAQVVGFSLEPPTNPNLFSICGLENRMDSTIGDVRDFDAVKKAVHVFKPEIVFHLAAQPIVLEGYRSPRETYETNVMGTVNVLEALRAEGCAKSVVNVTTDKVYLNEERDNYGYKESDPLDGYDPYSNSKSCSDLVTHSYSKSFLTDMGCAVSAARAGNVIGGGDFADNRIVPDCVRAIASKDPLVVRNPYSTRPYQHVLEPLFAYLMIAREQWDNPSLASSYNVGPDDCDCVTTGQLVQLFADAWGTSFSWVDASGGQSAAPHEASFLKLDSSKLKTTFNWQPRWHIAQAIEYTVEWTKVYCAEQCITDVMDRQIVLFRGE